MINPEPLNAHPHDAKQQYRSFLSQRWENIGTQAIHQDYWSFHLYLSLCHLLHNLHSLHKAIHRRNRETTRRPILRTSSWRREILDNIMYLNRSRDTPNLFNHSKQHRAVCGVSLHQGSTESCKTLEQKISFKSALLILTVSTNAFYAANLICCFSRYQAPTNSVAPSSCM